MHPAKQLLQLQTLDLERDAKQRRLKHVIASLVEPDSLRAASTEVAQAQSVASRAHARKQDLELETQTLDAKIKTVDERLYGGRVKNPKELSDLQNDLASLRRRRIALDDTLLEAMVALEDAELAAHKAAARLAGLQADWQRTQASLSSECAVLEAEIGVLTAQRDRLKADIAPVHLEPYQRLRQLHRGLAVARIEEDNCSGCGVELSERILTRARISDQLIFCGNCERILFVE